MSASTCLHQGDALAVLKTLPSESVHCCVTSNPYFGLRSYGVPPSVWGGDPACEHEWGEGIVDPARRGDPTSQKSNLEGGKATQIQVYNGGSQSAFCSKCNAWLGCLGLEPTYQLHIQNLLAIFREVRRVLRNDGTLWLNVGDSYAGSTQGGGDQSKRFGGGSERLTEQVLTQSAVRIPDCGIKAKNLMLMPHRLAIALQEDGWFVRSDIVWHKPNCKPESAKDRPTLAHEYLFLLSKSSRYYYDIDAIREVTGKEADPEFYEAEKARLNGWTGADATGNMARQPTGPGKGHKNYNHPNGRNKRSVWTVNTRGYPGAHFATFPPKLIEPCILAGTSERGCCEKCGAPWQRIVLRQRFDRSKDRIYPGSLGRNPTGKVPGSNTRGCPQPNIETVGWKPTCRCSAGVIPCTVLDPFCGSGTTGEVSKHFGRSFIGIELNESYCELARERIEEMPYYMREERRKQREANRREAARKAKPEPKPKAIQPPALGRSLSLFDALMERGEGELELEEVTAEIVEEKAVA